MAMPRPAGHPLNVDAWRDVLNLTGLTVGEVARRAEIPRPTLSYLALGKPVGKRQRLPGASAPNAVAIAKACGVHPRTLFPTFGSDGWSFRPPGDTPSAEDDEPEAEAA